MPDSFDTPRARRFARLHQRLQARTEAAWGDRWRQELLGHLTGTVLDLGAGDGVNLPHLSRAGKILEAEPSPPMRELLRRRPEAADPRVELVDAVAERLPVPDASVDVVVCTLVLCSVDAPAAALAEIKRVLRPGGRLVLIEHVRADGLRGRVQQWITGPWRRAACGCRPAQDTPALVRQAGFVATSVELRWPRPRTPIVGPFFVATARTATRQERDELRWLADIA